MINLAVIINALLVLAVVFAVGGIATSIVILIWTKKMEEQKETNQAPTLPKVMTNEQKAFALIYGRSVSIALVQENLGEGWEETMKMLYETGYVSIFTPNDQSGVKYELTTKGKKHYLASILPEEKKEDGDIK